MTEYFCPEGLPDSPGSLVLTDLEGRLVVTMLECLVAGVDVSSYAEEAQVILNGLAAQRERFVQGGSTGE